MRRKIMSTPNTRTSTKNSRNSRHTSADPPRQRQSAYTNHGTPTTTTGNSPARKEPNHSSNTITTPHSPSTIRTPTARTARGVCPVCLDFENGQYVTISGHVLTNASLTALCVEPLLAAAEVPHHDDRGCYDLGDGDGHGTVPERRRANPHDDFVHPESDDR